MSQQQQIDVEDAFDAFFDQSKNNKRKPVTLTRLNSASSLPSARPATPSKPVKRRHIERFYVDTSDEEEEKKLEQETNQTHPEQVTVQDDDEASIVSISPPPVAIPKFDFKKTTAKSLESIDLLSSSASVLSTPSNRSTHSLEVLDSDVEEVGVAEDAVDEPIRLSLRFNFGKLKSPTPADTTKGSEFAVIARFASIKAKVPVHDIVLCYNGVKLSMYATAKSIGMSDDAVIDVFNTSTYNEYLAEQERIRTNILKRADALVNDSDADNDNDNSKENEPEEEEDSVKLSIRDAAGKTVKVKVARSKTVHDLIHAFIKINKLDPNVKVMLKFDGETLDPSDALADVDVEDEDMLEAKVI